MAVILALDTSTEACSCALGIDGVVHERHEVVPRQHAQLILPMVRDLMAAHGIAFAALDAIAFGRGPGSFTGLRIAAGVTQGMAYAAELPVIPVSTLAAIAFEVFRLSGSRRVLACLDARIDEVYWGLFEFVGDEPVLVGEEHLTKPEAIALDDLDGDCAAGGNGLGYRARFAAALDARLGPCFPELLPRAGHIARIAAAMYDRQLCVSPEEVRPVYLRDKVTHQ